jgi:succinate-semialdehyde dehydrogenase / glutarate-semialdehyde dehydrogenase
MSVISTNPWSGEVQYRYEYMRGGEIEARLHAAQRGARSWAATPLEQRAALVRAAGEQLRARRETLAELAGQEMGKLRREALAEVDKCALACEYYAEHGWRYLEPDVVATEARRSFVAYQPLGCVLAIMPWNFPFWQVFRFLAPALVAGNVALLKHAVNVPRCADAIADLLAAAGLPEGVFGVLHIDNAQAAGVIADPRVVAVTLTGSERAGRSVAATAGKHLKKCVLELGGSDAFIVLEDADLDAAVQVAVSSRYGNAGQTCIAAKRFIVVDAVADAFAERFVAAAARLVPGDPADPDSSLAPMARSDLADGLHEQVLRSVQAGARRVLGGAGEPGSCRFPATVLDGVGAGMPAYHEELFGPVASILRVRDAEEAVRVANDSPYGLGASLWTADRGRGEALALRLEAGAVFVNALVRSDVRLPFGGIKRSGYGRELAAHGMREFVNIQSVWID